jgi:hypothetical protein
MLGGCLSTVAAIVESKDAGSFKVGQVLLFCQSLHFFGVGCRFRLTLRVMVVPATVAGRKARSQYEVLHSVSRKR